MIAVIQCASKKKPNATGIPLAPGEEVRFVSHPRLSPPLAGVRYAHLDEICRDGKTWREILVQYNRELSDNPLGLCRAIDLYANPTYERLAKQLGHANVYVLSAGLLHTLLRHYV